MRSRRILEQEGVRVAIKVPCPSRAEQELQNEGKKFPKWVLGIAASAVITIVTAIVTPIGGNIHNYVFPASPDISVFDIAFLPGTQLYDSGLDVRLENSGSQVAYVTDLDIRVEHTWKLMPSVGQVTVGAHQPSTFTYTYQLPPPSPPTTEVAVPVSQSLRPSEADRFSVLLKNGLLNNGRPNSTVYVYLLRIRAQYNGTVTPMRQLLLAVITPGSSVTSHVLGAGATAAIVRRNREILREILRVPTAVKGPQLQVVVSELSG